MTPNMPKPLEEGTTPERMQLVLPVSLSRRLDEWRAKQRPIPNKSQSVRMMTEEFLSRDEQETGDER